ncbi:MAG: DHA2 family efflux MFS transporter permease subunit [Candidatus Omnitrophica bacterium]|nr:DHA2 family efflux MFS transporter permease subunit [Candidatus Omnitrophota bacterium]
MQNGSAVNSNTVSWQPSHNPWLICIAVMSATIMEVLDTTITNVALPHIAGNLAVSTHEATWVLTSYLVSNAIILPAAAWFGGFFGRKRFLITCIILFTIASLLCGLARSLGFLLFARVFQGVGGGALMPISQAILLESFPKEKHGIAMAVFAIGVIVAPIVGPVVGGWITDNYSWRWVFFINLPVGIISALMTKAFIEDPPYIKRESAMIDYVGFAFMAIGLGMLQIVLDKGQEADWFQSPWLCRAAVITVISLIAFVFWELRTDHPIVNLRIFKDKNFSAGLIATALIGASMYGCMTLITLFYQTLLGYTAYLSGLVSAPLGIGAFVAAVAVGVLSKRFDGRILFTVGLVIISLACFSMGIINLQIGMYSKLLPILAIGFGMMISFVPLSLIAVGHLDNKDMGNGTGLFNLMRNIGGSIGIAITTTMLTRMGQIHQTFLAGHLTPYDPVYQQASGAMNPGIANGLIYMGLLQQSTLLAYIDSFNFFGILTILCLFTVFFYRKVDIKDDGMVGIH